MKIKKRDVGLDLVVLEQAGALAIQEEEATNEMTAQVAAMAVRASASGSAENGDTGGEATESDTSAKDPEEKAEEIPQKSELAGKRVGSDLEKKLEDLDLCSSTDSETSDSSSSSDDDSDGDTESDSEDSSDADTLKVDSPPDTTAASQSATAITIATEDATRQESDNTVQPKILEQDFKDADDAKVSKQDEELVATKSPVQNGASNKDNLSLNF